jgi:hypothetical protein
MDTVKMINSNLLLNGSIPSQKSAIIASAKNSIAVVVRPPGNANIYCDMKKNDARNAYNSPIYFFVIMYIIKGEIESINGKRSLMRYSSLVFNID